MNPSTPAEGYYPGARTLDTVVTDADPLGIHGPLDAKASKCCVSREQCAPAENCDEQQCLYQTHGNSEPQSAAVSFVTKCNSLYESLNTWTDVTLYILSTPASGRSIGKSENDFKFFSKLVGEEGPRVQGVKDSRVYFLTI